jgi:hypothetical protein
VLLLLLLSLLSGVSTPPLMFRLRNDARSVGLC